MLKLVLCTWGLWDFREGTDWCGLRCSRMTTLRKRDMSWPWSTKGWVEFGCLEEREGEMRVSRNSMGRDSGGYKCDSFLILLRALVWQEWNTVGMKWMAHNASEECRFSSIGTKVQLRILRREFEQWEKDCWKNMNWQNREGRKSWRPIKCNCLSCLRLEKLERKMSS